MSSTPVQFGITGSYFGVPVWTGGIAQTATFTYDTQVKETISDEKGRVVTRYYDDVTTTMNIPVIITSGSISGSAQLLKTVVTYNGADYIVEKITDSFKQKGFLVVTFDAITSENITV